MKNKHAKKNISLLIVLVIGIFIWLSVPAYATISCDVIARASCTKTNVLLMQNDTGGYSNAHAQNVSIGTYAYGLCCNADSDGQTVTTACDALSPIFLKLSATNNAHVEIPSLSNYLVTACIGVTNRNVTCTNATGSCSAGTSCILSIASSESADNNVTNAHVDNCSAYTTKICCGYNNRVPELSSIVLSSTSGLNLTSDNLTVTFTATDADSDAIYNTTDWRRNGVSIAVLNMPFNINTSSTTTGAIIDYSTFGNNGTLGEGTAGNAPTYVAGKIGGAYSFDGVNDYISVPPLTSPSGVLTLSVWVNTHGKGGTTYQGILDTTNSGYTGFHLRLGASDNNVRFAISGISADKTMTSATNLNNNTWYHIIATWDGTTNANGMKIYINGVLDAQDTATTNPPINASRNLVIGAEGSLGSSVFFNGSIDEVQIYNRSLSADEISAIYNAENAGRAVTTLVSNETIKGESWTVLAGACDGYVCTTGTSNSVTIANAAPTVSNVHISPSPAYTNTNLLGYCTGADVDNDNLSYAVQWYLNNALNASVYGATGVPDSYTKLLLHAEGIDGSTAFTDEAGKTTTVAGNTQIDTAQSKFGEASGLFDGTGDYLSVSDSDDWNFGDGNFTIDFWVRFNTLNAYNWLSSQRIDSNNAVDLHMEQTGPNYLWQFSIVSGGSVIISFYDAGSAITAGTWYHIAVVRNGNSWKLYKNGVNIASQTATQTVPDLAAPFVIGARGDDHSYPLNGSIDEFRVSKGIARWTADFTPPTIFYGGYAPGVERNFVNISNTSLTVGQNWTLGCKVDDGTVNSSWTNSTTTTIQAITPGIPTLIAPTNDNNTIHDRQPVFLWNSATNANNYEINVTSNTGCSANIYANSTPTGALNYTPSNLCVRTDSTPSTYYYWQVRACNSEACSNWSTQWNFSIEPYVVITLVNNSVSFGTVALGDAPKDTTSGTPNPFLLQNDGNVAADLVNVSASGSLWTAPGAGLGTQYFQMKARETTETSSFNTGTSIMTWVNISSTNQSVVKVLNYTDSTDSAYIDLRIEIPSAEPPGSKSTAIVFSFEQTP